MDSDFENRIAELRRGIGAESPTTMPTGEQSWPAFRVPTPAAEPADPFQHQIDTLRQNLDAKVKAETAPTTRRQMVDAADRPTYHSFDPLDPLLSGALKGLTSNTANYVGAAFPTAASYLNGSDTRSLSDRYLDYLATAKRYDEQRTNASPIADTLGDMGGTALQMGLVGPTTRGAGLLYNVANGAIRGVNDSPDIEKGRDVGLNAAISALANTAGSEGVGKVASRVMDNPYAKNTIGGHLIGELGFGQGHMGALGGMVMGGVEHALQHTNSVLGNAYHAATSLPAKATDYFLSGPNNLISYLMGRGGAEGATNATLAALAQYQRDLLQRTGWTAGKTAPASE